MCFKSMVPGIRDRADYTVRMKDVSCVKREKQEGQKNKI